MLEMKEHGQSAYDKNSILICWQNECSVIDKCDIWVKKGIKMTKWDVNFV
jgi:hypothetical protein